MTEKEILEDIFLHWSYFPPEVKYTGDTWSHRIIATVCDGGCRADIAFASISIGYGHKSACRSQLWGCKIHTTYLRVPQTWLWSAVDADMDFAALVRRAEFIDLLRKMFWD